MAAKASGAETFPAPPSLRGELSVASVAPKHAAVWENSFITKPEGYGKVRRASKRGEVGTERVRADGKLQPLGGCGHSAGEAAEPTGRRGV